MADDKRIYDWADEGRDEEWVGCGFLVFAMIAVGVAMFLLYQFL